MRNVEAIRNLGELYSKETLISTAVVIIGVLTGLPPSDITSDIAMEIYTKLLDENGLQLQSMIDEAMKESTP